MKHTSKGFPLLDVMHETHIYCTEPELKSNNIAYKARIAS